jgi:hypothetical protein
MGAFCRSAAITVRTIALAHFLSTPSLPCRGPASTDPYDSRSLLPCFHGHLYCRNCRTVLLNFRDKYCYSRSIEVKPYRLYRRDGGAVCQCGGGPTHPCKNSLRRGWKHINHLLPVTTERVVPCPWSWHFTSPPFLLCELQRLASLFEKWYSASAALSLPLDRFGLGRSRLAWRFFVVYRSPSNKQPLPFTFFPKHNLRTSYHSTLYSLRSWTTVVK